MFVLTIYAYMQWNSFVRYWVELIKKFKDLCHLSSWYDINLKFEGVYQPQMWTFWIFRTNDEIATKDISQPLISSIFPNGWIQLQLSYFETNGQCHANLRVKEHENNDFLGHFKSDFL